ncbi:MAG TPA: VWA domain-containing protein [Pirellulales bacterium]|jgi:Mg-chelatase subunit ChlD|nr:VWA domain-containing protein [Pirellulales bacterium]
MFDYRLDFDRPALLLLLLLAPAIWFGVRGSLAAMGRGRWFAALLLRTTIFVLLVAALAEVQIVRTIDRLAVIYLVDRSWSVSPDQARAAIEYVNRSRAEHLDRRHGDMAGVIVFGRRAAVELPPIDEDLKIARIETHVDPDGTNLADALGLAEACFPPDCAKRVVIVSDGNENLGEAAEAVQHLIAAGVGVDVVPLHHQHRNDVAVEKVTAPPEVRRDVPFDLRVVLNNSAAEADRAVPVAGRLQVFRRTGDGEQLLSEEAIVVRPGKHVFSLRDKLKAADFYTYNVRFTADNPAHDAVPQNDRGSAFTQVRGKGWVLLIEDSEHRGQFDDLARRLREAGNEITVAGSAACFTNLADLQRYDTVILANVPRTSSQTAEDLPVFSDEQIELLVRNTQQMGSGLVMLGGPRSFGAGGWADTRLEAAMPVDFQIKSAKVVPIGALMLVIDSSGSMSGEKIEMSKAAAIATLKVLSPRDFLGVVCFDSAARWIVPTRRVGGGEAIVQLLRRIGAGGGTDMMPGMQQGYQALAKVDSAVKHMIVLTDGQTAGAGYPELAARMNRQGITTTSVAIGADAANPLMQSIAQAGGGKFYHVVNPQAVPRIFMNEARRVARPLVFEDDRGFQPKIELSHEMLKGIDSPPPITGYVLTSVKQNPLVEVLLSSPQPAADHNPILASWTYGLGRTVALTTDAGQRWAKDWLAWPNYDKLFSQMVRWSMRPLGGEAGFTIATDVRDRKLQVVVSALEPGNQLLNFLTMDGMVVGPDLTPLHLPIKQVAPGRYVGECPVERAGSYFVTVAPSERQAPLRTGVTVTEGSEFRNLPTNETLLASLAALEPKGGHAGEIIDIEDSPSEAPVGAIPNVFRRDLERPTNRQPSWNLLLLAAGCLFLVDVFNRRVDLGSAVVEPLVKRLRTLGRKQADQGAASEAIARLRNRKTEIAEHIDQRRAAYSPPVEHGEGSAVAPVIAAGEHEPPPKIAPEPKPEEPAEEDYTARLLRAKQRVWRDRQ